MQRIIIIFTLIVTVNKLNAQFNQEILAKFKIMQSELNGADNTGFDIERGGYVAFYNTNGVLCMANVASKWQMQSYGPLLSVKSHTITETSNNYRTDVFTFRWKYSNSYDRKRGYASILLTKVYKPQGISFKLQMILANLDVIIYEGYMEGSLNFDQYFK